MTESQCCETCARPVPFPMGEWWCNALARRIYDWEMDVYPPCGKARWMPRDERIEDDERSAPENDKRIVYEPYVLVGDEWKRVGESVLLEAPQQHGDQAVRPQANPEDEEE